MHVHLGNVLVDDEVIVRLSIDLLKTVLGDFRKWSNDPSHLEILARSDGSDNGIIMAAYRFLRLLPKVEELTFIMPDYWNGVPIKIGREKDIVIVWRRGSETQS